MDSKQHRNQSARKMHMLKYNIDAIVHQCCTSACARKMHMLKYNIDAQLHQDSIN